MKEWLHEDRLAKVRQVVSTSRINVPKCELQERIGWHHNMRLVQVRQVVPMPI